MRIAVWHDPPTGGALRALDELSRRLGDQHAVDVFALARTVGEASRPAELRVERISFQPRRHRRLAFYWNDWQTLRDYQDLERLESQLATRIDGEGYDVALTSVLRNGQAPALLRYLRTPGIYYCHEPPRRFYEPWCRPEAGPQTAYERARQAWRWPTQTLLDNLVRRRDREHVRRASLVLANSHYTTRRVRRVYRRDASVCYLGVDTDQFRPAETPAPPTGVISVGTLEPHKGFDFVVRALGQVPYQRRPRLTIVGSGGHPRMASYLQRLADQEQVILDIRRGVSDAELVSLYQSNALFVFGARYEPFGLVVLEALSCGLPVVGVAEGGVPEIVSDGATGRLVPRDEATFGAEVDNLLSDDTGRLRLGVAARECVAACWNWSDAARRLEGHLARTIGRKDGPSAWGEA